MIRLFIGIELPEGVRQALATLCNGVPGARWVATENLHLTLRFIGEVGEPHLEDIDLALSGVRAGGFDLELSGVGHFESAGQVRTLWAGVVRNPALLALRERIDAALSRAGIEPEGRRFLPHVTLARVRDTPSSRASAFLSHHGLFRSPSIPVDRFVLFSSLLGRNGAIHRPEADYPLMDAVPVLPPSST